MKQNFEQWLSWTVVFLCGTLFAAGVVTGALSR